MKLLEEVRKGKRRWFLAATAFLLLSSVLATTAFLLSYEEGYPTWEELVDQIKEAEQSDSRLVRVKVVGRSFEGRPIQSVSVNGNENEGPLVWIVCGLHAREWVSPLACIHVLQALIQDLPSEPELQKVAFHIVAMANPDSYVFTMGGKLGNRLKRKNMADSGCSDPLYNGVDLNRNFPVGFNLSSNRNCVPQWDTIQDTSGLMHRARGPRDNFCGGCSNTYGGQHPFSEPETESLRSALTEDPPWIFIDIHASAGAWFTPPCSRQRKPGEDHDEWNLDFLTEFLKRKFSVTYSTGQASSLLGEMGGCILDWVYEDLGVVRAYGLELVSGWQWDETLTLNIETLLSFFQCPIKVAREEVLPPVWAALKLLVKEAWRRDFSPPSHNKLTTEKMTMSCV